jgi:hypothetical protein
MGYTRSSKGVVKGEVVLVRPGGSLETGYGGAAEKGAAGGGVFELPY